MIPHYYVPFCPAREQKPKLHVMATATTIIAAAAAVIITRACVLMETNEAVMPAR